MKHRTSLSFGLALGLLLFAMTVTAVAADLPPLSTCTFSPETRHNIHGVFWSYYSNHNGMNNFGPPLTEAFLEKGIVVQVFERAKFEFHPEFPEPYRVQLSLLGMQYGVFDAPIRSPAIPPASNPNYRYFPATGQVISFEIKKYFESHGGWELFGYPVSDIRYEGGKFVQYFQRSRLEWFPLENRVVGSPVGQMALNKYPSDFPPRKQTTNDWCSDGVGLGPGVPAVPTVTPAFMPTPVLFSGMNVQVRSRFRQAGPGGPQYVEVTVTDQNGKTLPGVGLVALVRFASGDRVFPLLATDSSGRSSFSFDLGNQPLNYATIVEVTAYSGALTAVGRDSFTR